MNQGLKEIVQGLFKDFEDHILFFEIVLRTVLNLGDFGIIFFLENIVSLSILY